MSSGLLSLLFGFESHWGCHFFVSLGWRTQCSPPFSCRIGWRFGFSGEGSGLLKSHSEQETGRRIPRFFKDFQPGKMQKKRTVFHGVVKACSKVAAICVSSHNYRTDAADRLSRAASGCILIYTGNAVFQILVSVFSENRLKINVFRKK